MLRRARELTARPAACLGPAEFTDIFLGAGYYQSTWLDLAEAFAAWSTTTIPSRCGPVRVDDNGYAIYGTRAPTPSGRTTGALAARQQAVLKAPFVTWDNAWYNAPCLFWPATAARR